MPDKLEVKQIVFNAGATICVQDAVNPGFFYIIKEGQLSVRSDNEYAEKELSRFEPGDTFGLVSALTTGRFLATVTAATTARVIRIPIDLLGSYLKHNKNICMKMLRLYARELKTLDRHLANLTVSMEPNNPANLYEIFNSYHLLKKRNLAGHALLNFVRWAEKNAPDLPALIDARKKLQGPYAFYKAPDLSANKCQLLAGEVLFTECEPGPNAYVIKSGSVMVSALAGNHEFILAVLGPGEIIGELSLLENLPHGATVVAREPTELIKLSGDTFHEEVGEVILQKIFESLARRIWLAHQRLSILKVRQPSARLYFYLFSLILHRKLSRTGQINFNFGLEELCRMCGLLRVKRESISEFMNDPNIEIGKSSITIEEASVLEKKALSYKFRSGRELENLFL